MEKAYCGDIIEIVKPDPDTTYKKGAIFEVDFRQSDLGACDDDILTTTTEEYIADDEYIILKKRNKRHYLEDIHTNYLSKSNEELLKLFKNSTDGENEFSHFLDLVRTLIK